MKHGFSEETYLFIRGCIVGGSVSYIAIFNLQIHGYAIIYAIVIKLCSVGTIAFLSGLLTVLGKKAGLKVWVWLTLLWKWITGLRIFKRKKKSDPPKFSKNGTHDNKNVA